MSPGHASLIKDRGESELRELPLLVDGVKTQLNPLYIIKKPADYNYLYCIKDNG